MKQYKQWKNKWINKTKMQLKHVQQGDETVQIVEEEEVDQQDENVVETCTTSQVLIQMLYEMGVRFAFGMVGGAIQVVMDSIEKSPIQMINNQHESGAVFSAIEAYFASDTPALVYVTTGPGLINALNGIYAAKWEGAKMILISAATAHLKLGMRAIQDTSLYGMPQEGLLTSGGIFDFATIINHPRQLIQIQRKIGIGLCRPQGFIAHLSIPYNIQNTVLEAPIPRYVPVYSSVCMASQEEVDHCADILGEGPFAIWVGFGARNASNKIRALAELTGAGVMCSPKGKGTFPEDHPQYVGITGFAGHESVHHYMKTVKPLTTLVLGSSLSEPASSWDQRYVPKNGFIQVDIDPTVPGTSYPNISVISIHSEVGLFTEALTQKLTSIKYKNNIKLNFIDKLLITKNNFDGKPSKVRPNVLMHEIQQVIVEGSDAIVMADPGNSMAWTIHYLRFSQPKRFRMSLNYGSMTHFSCGVFGASITTNKKVVVIVGDGAMLMQNEVATAVKHNAQAVWIILNDGAYNMCQQGGKQLGFVQDFQFPQVDFKKYAESMGATGVRVFEEGQLRGALERAMLCTSPIVVDVLIDPNVYAPNFNRYGTLMEQFGQQNTCNGLK